MGMRVWEGWGGWGCGGGRVGMRGWVGWMGMRGWVGWMGMQGWVGGRLLHRLRRRGTCLHLGWAWGISGTCADGVGSPKP